MIEWIIGIAVIGGCIGLACWLAYKFPLPTGVEMIMDEHRFRMAMLEQKERLAKEWRENL